MTRQRTILTCAICMLVCASSTAAHPHDERELSPRQALQTLMRELAQEAREAKQSFTLPRLQADYTAQFPHDVDRKLLAMKFVRPVDRDPFTDAYIRWQMTSFLDGLPAMDDAKFEKFLSELPACVVNPQTDDAFITPMMQASEAGELSPSDQEHVEALIAELDAKREQAGVLRRPAEALRLWIQEQVGEEGHRPIQVMLERCAALARAGWDVDGIKEGIAAQCEASFRDRSFSDEERERVARQAEKLAGISTLRITRAYLSEGSLIVNTDSVHVADYETRKWVREIKRQ